MLRTSTACAAPSLPGSWAAYPCARRLNVEERGGSTRRIYDDRFCPKRRELRYGARDVSGGPNRKSTGNQLRAKHRFPSTASEVAPMSARSVWVLTLIFGAV